VLREAKSTAMFRNGNASEVIWRPIAIIGIGLDYGDNSRWNAYL